MMCARRVLLIRSIIAASVVDLPEPVGPGDQDQALRDRAQVLDHLGQPELLEGQDLARDLPQRRAEAVRLAEDVDAEAREARHRVGEVDVQLLPELLLVPLLHHGLEQPEGVLPPEDRGVRDLLHVSVDAPVGLQARREVQVGSALRHDPLEHLVELGRARG